MLREHKKLGLKEVHKQMDIETKAASKAWREYAKHQKRFSSLVQRKFELLPE